MKKVISPESCIFCDAAQGRLEVANVYENPSFLAFLDHRPLFPGHCLLIPKPHIGNFLEMPRKQLEPFFALAQRLAKALELALPGTQGSLLAINNKVSQNVPHLHLHVVSRKKGGGLKGFFWPCNKHRDPAHLAQVQQAIQQAMKQ